MVPEDEIEDEISEEFPLYNKMLIDHQGSFFAVLNGLYVIICLLSSYFYGFLSCFNMKDE